MKNITVSRWVYILIKNLIEHYWAANHEIISIWRQYDKCFMPGEEWSRNKEKNSLKDKLYYIARYQYSHYSIATVWMETPLDYKQQ